MTFEITQQDLDICKMNGLDENDLNGFIADRQGWGLSDEEINARLRMLINDCKQTTPQSENDLQNISKWKQQPPISPFEYGKMNSYAIINDAKNSLSFTPEINPQSPSERQKNGFTPDDISSNEYESLKKGVKYLGKKINEQGEKLGKWVVYRNLNKKFYEPTGRTDKIGFWEATKDIVKQGTALPFIGGYVSGAQKQIILDIDEKIKNGEKISADEAYAYECLLNKVKEERTRGYSNWGLIGSSVLPSMVRFGGEIALTGGTMNALGVTTKLPKAASISQKFAHGVKDSLKLGTAATALNPSEIYDRYQNRTFENQMKLTPEGETYFVDSLEKPATTFLKSMGDVFLSFACEGSGSALGATGEFIGNGLSKGVAKVTDPVLQHIVKNKNMRKLVEEVCPKILDSAQKKFSQFDKFFDKTRFLADKVKFDGFLEEIGEEKLEDYLSLTFGLQDEKPSLENYVKAFGDLDDWAVLSGSILLQGSVLSATSRILEKSLKKSSAMSDEEIQEVVNSLPITEQREVVKNMIDNGLIQPEIVQKVQSEEFWKDLQNQRYQQHIEKGLSEQNAKVAASLDSLFGAMFSNLFNVSDEEAADLLPTFKSEEFRNKEQFKQKIERSRFIRKIQDDFKDSDTLSDYLAEINSTEYENLSPEEKYNYAVSREIEKYDNEHISNKPLDNKTEYVVDDEYSPKNLNILQGRVEYNDNVNENNSDEISESSQYTEMPIKLSQDEIYDIMGEIGDINDGELIDPFLRALQGQADTNDVEQLKIAVSGLQHGGKLEYILNNQNGNTFYQSAMMQGINPNQKVDVVDLSSRSQNIIDKKSLLSYINSLVGQNGITTKDKKAILNFIQKSYRIDKNGKGFNINVPRHIVYSSLNDNRAERSIVVNNIVDLIKQSVMIEVEKNTKKSGKPYVDEYYRFYVPVRINSDIYTIRLVAENQNKNNLFNIVKPSVYDVIIDKKRTSPKVTNAPVLRSPNNSINHFQQNTSAEQITIRDMLTNVEDADGNVYYQSAYHGTPHKFDEFSTENIGSGEGHQAHGWGLYFASNKKVSEDYRETLSDTIGIGTEILVDNVTYKKIATNTYKKKDNIYDSVDDYLNKALNFIEIQGSKKKALKYVQEQIDNHKDAGYFDDAVYYIRIKDALNEIIKAKITKYADDYGQLYEVEIPEDEEMLDEDLPFSEQPKKVQDAIKQICEDYVDNNKLVDLNVIAYTNNTSEKYKNNLAYKEGRNIYGIISEAFGGDKQASLLLNEYGIKGIKYNGQTDGQCYVIFNPENIDITRTFYQEGVNPKDSIEQRTDKSKYLTDNEVEQLKKDKENFVVYVQKMIDDKLSPLTQIRVLEKLPSAYNKIPQLKGKKVVITQNVYKKIIDLPNKFNKNHNIDKKRALKLPEYLSDPLYILQSTSEGNEHRFVVVTASKGNKPKEKLSIILQPNNNVAVVSAYDEIINISEEKKNNRVLYDKKKELSKTLSASKAVTIDNSDTIITNSASNFNPKQSQKRTGYVLEQQSSSQPNLFAESASERLGDNSENLYVQPKNSYRGRAVLDKQLILVTATGDVSTVVHEYAHWYLGILQDAEGYSDKVDDQLYAIRKYLNNDGSPFTRQQHEKFAKSFENYIYRGTAKNSKLREIYEDIKNVLYNIYEIIQKGEYFIGGENPLSDEDMANSNAVFEELFRLENNNLQERVFKKIDDCNNMIADVKNKEKEEIARIYQIRDNIKQNIKEQGEIEKSVREIKEFAEKYAEKKENAKWKLYNEDRQNTAYNILSNALGLPVADIKRKLHSRFAKTREDIELKLREVGDKLSAGDYFYDEKVIEYFGSIDMTDTDSSQQLVNMALDAIDTKVNLDSPLNRDINEFLNKFDYLKKQFAKYKGKQRSLIIDVIGDLFNELTSSSLPSVFISDFSTEMQKLTENYEEALDNRAAKTTNSEFYGLVLAKLKNVKLYSAADKHAVKINHLHDFYSKLPLAKTANGAEKLIREINNALIRDIEMRKKSIIAKEIAKQLRVNSRTQKVGSRVKKGLYDWKTNSVWLDMVKFNNMNMAELSSELEKVLTPEIKAICNVDDGLKEMTTAKENSSTVDFSFESKMKKKFIEYKLSGKLENANSALMLDLLSDILEFKNKARKAKSEKELHDMLQKYDFRNNLAERILNNPNKIKKVIKYLFKNNSLLNWNTILRVCFGNDVAEKYSIDNEENEKVIYENKILTNFYNKALKCYKLNKTKGLRKFFFDPHGIHEFQKLFRDYEKETFSTNETIYDFKTKEEKTSPILLNRAQLITMFTWYQNELLKKRLINQFGGEYYGEKELERLFNHLSDEDKQFAFLLMQTCDDMYDDVNEVMIRSQGLSMEKNENYFPSVVRRRGDSIDNVSLVNCRIGQPSATKKRVKSQFVAMKPLNPLSILSRHIDTMSSYVCVSEKASFVSEIFGSPDLQRAFENAFDEQYTEFINNIGIDKSSLSKSVTPIALDNNSIPDFKTVSELKNWICENVDLLGNVKIESNGRNVLFSKSNIGRSLKGVQRSDVKQKSYSVLKQLVEKSVYGYDKKVDQKHSKRNNGQEIYYNAFTYKGKTFDVEISIDKPFSKKSPNTYAGHKIKIIETVPATSRNGSMPSYGSDTATPEINGTKLPDLTSATISISNIVKAFNPIKDIKVHKNKTTDGKEFWDLLSGQLAASTFFKYSQSVRTMTENVRKWINNWIVSSIALSPKIAFGQLLSCINYADGNDISVMDWAKGFIYCMAHPKETIEYMKQDEYLQARFKGNLQNETMQSLLSQYDKWNEVRTFFTANIRIGDMLAIMFGGKPYIDHLMKQGISKEEAFARFRRKTNEAQQSTLPSTISNFQRTSQSNAVSALFLAFTNTPHQYERKVIESIAELCRGQDKKTANKNLILYRIVSPLLFEFVLQDLGIWLVMGAVGGDDDKGKIALIAAINSLLLGNYGAYGAMGIFGAFLVNVVCNCMSDKNMPFSTSSIPMLSSAERNVYSILNDIKKGDLKTEHLISAAALAGDLSTGMPLTKMSNMANGVGNMMIDGDFMVGLHKALGWGDSASRQAFE